MGRALAQTLASEVYAAEMLTLDIEDPEGLLTQPAKGRLTFSAITVPASDTHFFNRSKKKGKTTPTDPKNSEQGAHPEPQTLNPKP
jgi:hypothetical protein